MFKALFIASKTWQQLSCPSAGKWINNGTFRYQNTIQHQKKLSYQATKGYGGTSQANYCIKEANLKRLLTIQVQLYNILGNTKLQRQLWMGGCQELSGGGMKRSRQEFQGNKTILKDTIVVGLCHYTSVKNHRMYTTNSKP